MTRLVHVVLALTAAGGLVAAAQPVFKFEPAGHLVRGSGRGRVETRNYAEGIRFPLEAAPAYSNSQVWGRGGVNGGAGSQCDAANYSYPWHDNYCETRSWVVSLCPAGQGHQGQDIRPATCRKDIHWAVAADDGRVDAIGTYSLFLRSPDGNTRYDYLHMSGIAVKVGDRVKRGTRLGLVRTSSRRACPRPSTCISISDRTSRNWDGPMCHRRGALVDSYQRLLAGKS